jgi:hypothetical protein
MTRLILNIGIASSLIIVILQLFFGLYVFLDFNSINTVRLLTLCYTIFGILIFIALWNVLVKFHNQTQLDILLKLLIGFSTAIMILTNVLEFVNHKPYWNIILIIISFITLIFEFNFFLKIIYVDKHEVKQIEQLKNFALVFVICILGLFAIGILNHFKVIMNIDFLKHFLIAIPYLFLGKFFIRTRNYILYN